MQTNTAFAEVHLLQYYNTILSIWKELNSIFSEFFFFPLIFSDYIPSAFLCCHTAKNLV